MPAANTEADHVGFTKGIGLWWDAQPNGSRLSCGAASEVSQTEFYNTALKRVTAGVEHGRRQLQALVRRHHDTSRDGSRFERNRCPTSVSPSPQNAPNTPTRVKKGKRLASDEVPVYPAIMNEKQRANP